MIIKLNPQDLTIRCPLGGEGVVSGDPWVSQLGTWVKGSSFCWDTIKMKNRKCLVYELNRRLVEPRRIIKRELAMSPKCTNMPGTL